MAKQHEGPFRHALRALGGGEDAADQQIRHAAWVARCVGRGSAAPLQPADVGALANTLAAHDFRAGKVVFAAGDTFRAAASDQLRNWAGRTDRPACGSCGTARSNYRSDPAAGALWSM